MFLYPALLAGFAFVAVPLLVHLINMLRHRRRRWAAMDFLLASYRKQKKWVRLRQLLLLLSRLAIAAVLVALLCGWTGGRRILGVLGGQTTHHIVILDDSYSMGDASGGGETTAYNRALAALQQLTHRLASDDGNHQLTVMRASRAALAIQGGSDSGDAAADLSAQTITSDSGLIARVMATDASPIRTDLVPALDLAGELATSTSADQRYVYLASDFRARDWAATERLAESMRKFSGGKTQIRMIDCAERPERNLAVTDLSPVQDVWVAGVPVVVRATVKNYSSTPVKNVTLACRVIRYGESVNAVDPSRRVSGVIDTLPGLIIESLAPGAQITKSFQVFVNETGTHAIEVELPADALQVDNTRTCTLPLSDVERVLVIDSNLEEAGAYTIAAVLDPGSQVRIGAVPDIKQPAFLRSATLETLAAYRAVYLVNLPEITDSAAAALDQYVRQGGGVAWFLGDSVHADSYNRVLLNQGRHLLPAPLDKISEVAVGGDKTGDVLFGDEDTLLDPLRSAGDASLSMIGVAKGWTLLDTDQSGPSVPEVIVPENESETESARYRDVLKRRDGVPLVTEHVSGAGTVVTVLCGLDPDWTNWAGDPTFVPFMLLSNARLWSGASATTFHQVDQPLRQGFSTRDYFPEVKLVPSATSPPRVAMEITAATGDGAQADRATLVLDPVDQLIASESNVDDLLRPGIFEWGLLGADGGGEVIPAARTIAGGEGDLERADAAEIQRGMLPVEVRFVSSTDWTQENQLAGSSSIGLMLLAILGLLLAAEQALAYWASYHGRSDTAALGSRSNPEGGARTRSSFGLNAAATSMGGRHA
ncbi:BatA domain-containing protein [Stieleria sp. TO1_6]|uniref:BatA domain-containing protein n=1 Tax=Stieleria tagensis TaxID=2956795 RepID=UPI00209B6053|nr:BatA domain-containing protein [Stieleria tagensis]MCO8125352.1 BatA domain-containing protein [Stieleria tagensis]